MRARAIQTLIKSGLNYESHASPLSPPLGGGSSRGQTIPAQTLLYPVSPTDDDERQANTFVAKKYKPVAQKVRPVLADLPEKFRINRNIVGNPLADMPALSPTPPPFQPTGHLFVISPTVRTPFRGSPAKTSLSSSVWNKLQHRTT